MHTTSSFLFISDFESFFFFGRFGQLAQARPAVACFSQFCITDGFVLARQWSVRTAAVASFSVRCAGRWTGE